IALVLGRFILGRGAGTTNVVWGYIVHDPIASGLIALIGGAGFMLIQQRQVSKYGVLVLLPAVTMLRYPYDGDRLLANVLLSSVLAWIYSRIPDDLALSSATAHPQSRSAFQFFKGNRAVLSLDQSLVAAQVGEKAANLAQLRRWGYPVPMGWVLPAGDDPAPLVASLHPDGEHPLVVRSSAIGEDSDRASAAGQYRSILNLTSQPALQAAILECQASYTLPAAADYRQRQGTAETGMAIIIQQQVDSIFSGVAFSRDPIARAGNAVVIEGSRGVAQVVSGRVTPDRYRVWVDEIERSPDTEPVQWQLPDSLTLTVEGEGELPPLLVHQIAYLTRHLETQYHGVPQDVEWSYDGQLWVLQTRPITTLLPLWTRKIAAEVIPGFIHPLTWSINRPLTCGVWGDIFTVVLGDRAQGLEFEQTATLHHSAAYFNASLLGEIFLRMGLPPESLEFLTRGAKFSKPPLRSTLGNLPGLLRLLQREWQVGRAFQRDRQQFFTPGLAELTAEPITELSPSFLLERIDSILDLLQRATYYNILAPLSLALRRSLLKVPETALDSRQTPEVAAVRSLQALAADTHSVLPVDPALSRAEFLNQLAETEAGRSLLQRFDRFLQDYGYLSEVATDIAVPTWRDDPTVVQELWLQFWRQPSSSEPKARPNPSWKTRHVQQRLDLKGEVATIYDRLLAELRWAFLALEQHGRDRQDLSQAGDIFFLRLDEIRQWVAEPDAWQEKLAPLIHARRSQLERDRQTPVPYLVYGNAPPQVERGDRLWAGTMAPVAGQLQGIGASPGWVEGRVLVLSTMQLGGAIDRETILVLPYTDAGWSPLLVQAGGIIAEAGGQLSHGAIIAREYGIPAVMNVTNAMQVLSTGQRVRLDGERGTIEIL
ncbi:MAG: pyruvate phosphate dikinase PEP/pyruvate-binding protein, partial [Leptolyngbyaceae cyanobacterium SL_7_1]|nr:pyruvate phosphate dikinase PEP/pyruvate-binding protein [Leptolyngbyaceae cyanobacterium SL_7_1]